MRPLLIIIAICLFSACSDKLDIKPNSSLILPSSVSDFESMLDNTTIMNTTPALAQLSADEYFISSFSNWQSLINTVARNAYIWKPDIYEGKIQVSDWTIPYAQIYYSNSILDLLKKEDLVTTEMKNIKGWALFNRAYAFYNLVSIYSKGYTSETANSDLGIPLKLTSGITEIVQRSTLQETYNRIIGDLEEAVLLLQRDIPFEKKNRPSKVAAYALLARVFLSMRDYEKAEKYADQSLEIYSKLIDFNTLTIKKGSSFNYNSEETIYFSQQGDLDYQQTTNSFGELGGIDPDLLEMYHDHDSRKNVYFRANANGNYFVKGINSPTNTPFTGLATDEIFLIKAECLARRSETIHAMAILNQLLSTRWNPNEPLPFLPYKDLVANGPEDALTKVLLERRKGLIWRSLRWTDIKRLNLEGRNITLTRDLSGKTHILSPNSPLYVLPIPDDEMLLSGIKPNIR